MIWRRPHGCIAPTLAQNLNPLSFNEAVTDILKVTPEPKVPEKPKAKKQRRSQRH